MSAPRVLYLVKICSVDEIPVLADRYGFFDYLDFVEYYLRYGMLKDRRWCDGVDRGSCVAVYVAPDMVLVDSKHLYLAVSEVVKEGVKTRLPPREEYEAAFKEGRVIDMNPSKYEHCYAVFKRVREELEELRGRVIAALGRAYR